MRCREIINESGIEVFGDVGLLTTSSNKRTTDWKEHTEYWIDRQQELALRLSKSPIDIHIVINIEGDNPHALEQIKQKYAGNLSNKVVFILQVGVAGGNTPLYQQSVWMFIHDLIENGIASPSYKRNPQDKGQIFDFSIEYVKLLEHLLNDYYDLKKANDQPLSNISYNTAKTLLISAMMTMLHGRNLQAALQKKIYTFDDKETFEGHPAKNYALKIANMVDSGVFKEEAVEIIVQYLFTGKVKFNPLPPQINTGDAEYILKPNSPNADQVAAMFQKQVVKDLSTIVGTFVIIKT
jgi:hypothetical protein